MFNDAKYTSWYLKLVERAGNRKVVEGVYYEKHHIQPKSLGGRNTKDNLVYLTGREHYVAHLLLLKMCVEKKSTGKMVAAFKYMSNVRNNYTQRRYNSRLFEYHRKISKRLQSETMRGENHPNFGKHWSEEIRQKMSNGRMGINTNTPEMIERKRNHWLKNNPNDDPVAKKKAVEKLSKTWELIDRNGNVLIVKNLRKFCRENNLHQGNFCSVAQGLLPHYRGYRCRPIELHK